MTRWAPDWGSMHPIVMVMMLVFWGVVSVGIVLAVRWLASAGREPGARGAALTTLEPGHARGAVIREAIHGTIRRLAERPDKAQARDRPATAVIEEGLRCRTEGPGGWMVMTDMPSALGGGGTAPTPGWLSRAAQASCLATVIAMRAAQEGVVMSKLEVAVDSESDTRGMLGTGDAVPPGPVVSRARIRIAAPGVAPDRLREIVRWADAHSPVSDAIGRAIPRSIEVEAS